MRRPGGAHRGPGRTGAGRRHRTTGSGSRPTPSSPPSTPRPRCSSCSTRPSAAGPAPSWPPPGGATSSRRWSTWPPTGCRPTPTPGRATGTGCRASSTASTTCAAAWTASEAGQLPDVLPLYAFTTSAIDPTLAPPGHHTVYLACPAAPRRVRGRLADPAARSSWSGPWPSVEERAPGFRSSIVGVHARTPDVMERDEGLARRPSDAPRHRPRPARSLPARPAGLGGHRTPVEGLYVSGAGTNPTGGIAGTPGRMAARALLADRS